MTEDESQKANPTEMLSDEQRKEIEEEKAQQTELGQPPESISKSVEPTQPIPETQADIEARELVALSEKSAKGKLAILLDPNKTDFSVRLINRAEIQRLISEHSFGYKEVFRVTEGMHKAEGSAYNFTEYLDQAKKNWAETAEQQTSWPESIDGIHVTKLLLNLLEEARNEAKSEMSDNFGDERRDKTMKIFRNKIMEQYRRWESYKQGNSSRGSSNHIGYSNVFSLIHSIESERERFDRYSKLSDLLVQEVDTTRYNEIISLIQKNDDSFKTKFEKMPDTMIDAHFDEDKDYHSLNELIESLHWAQRAQSSKMFLNKQWGENRQLIDDFLFGQKNDLNPDELRKFIETLAAGRQETDQKNVPTREMQYEYAMIVDDSAIDIYYGGKWDRTKRDNVDGKTLLGIVVINPLNRTLSQEAIGLMSHDKGWACPIFDSHGNVMWPREKKLDPETSSG